MLKSVIYMHRFQLNDATEAQVERSRSEIPDRRSEIPTPHPKPNRFETQIRSQKPLEWRVQVEPGAKKRELGGAGSCILHRKKIN